MPKKYSIVFVFALCILFVFPGAALADGEAGPPFRQTLTLESQGPDVEALQIKLAELGLYEGGADGLFGAELREAVKAFQRANGLREDGIVNRATYNAILNAKGPAGAAGEKPEYKFGKMNNQITLSKGDRGGNVKDLQMALKMKGFYYGSVNGSFDARTKSAVMKFQRSVRLKSDGLAGNYTLSAVYTMLYPPDLNALAPWPESANAGFNIPVEKLKWSHVAKEVFKRGMDAVVVDIQSGYAFHARRTGGTHHADVETLTPADTATFYKSVGNFSWDRRPVWVLVNGHRLAASMNCMPHGYDTMPDNDFKGQFCIHFVGSRTHGSDKVDEDHQACIEKAYQLGIVMRPTPSPTPLPTPLPTPFFSASPRVIFDQIVKPVNRVTGSMHYTLE